MDKGMKTRWISLYVENQVGVLSKISGLFSGKSYNLDSLTVGTTEDPTVSRMTIATVSDDETFEQIKKQLNRMVEVIKVIDFTDVFVRMKEILYIKVKKCTAADKVELFQIAETFKARSGCRPEMGCFHSSWLSVLARKGSVRAFTCRTAASRNSPSQENSTVWCLQISRG